MLKFTANLSLLFTEADLIERFEAASRQDFTAVEIQFPYALDAQTLKNALTAAGQKLVLFNVDADDLLQGGEGLACVPEKQARFRQAVAQTLAYAEVLKPAAINVLPGRCLNESRLPKYMKTFKENLCFAADAFAPLGIKTVFEAINTCDMPGFIIHSGAQMLAVLDELDRPDLFMQYDVYHMQMMGEDPIRFIADHADKIGHIQFADCPGRAQPGTGRIDFERLFSAIEKSGYSGWVGAEYKPMGTTLDSLDWFRKLERERSRR
ncbi:hydroxypyruvate isomerase family protein [Methylobacter sp. sgz302048]|uniref:hydroxypyruvate isomerase family protein n=1 Tax=Methylobacter sp. sgz302048 TaxID=3455945 RepID=UPI003FA0DBEF